MLIFLQKDIDLKKEEEEIIEIATTIESDGEYYISYLGGSTIYGETIKIQIDGNEVVEEEVIYTQTKDTSSIILKDIYTRLDLKKGPVQLKVFKPSKTVVYEIHLSLYDAGKELNGFYESDNDVCNNAYKVEPNNNEIAFNKYLIIRNWSASYGGFWWCVNLALHGCLIAETYGLIPIIEYKGGLYSSNKIYEPLEIRQSDNWWNYFFKEPSNLSKEVRQKVLENKKLFQLMNLPRNKSRLLRRQKPYILPEIPEDTSYEYVGQSFQHCYKLFRPYDRNIINKYLVIRPYIIKYIDNYWLNAGIPDGTTLVGVHYRGTDKFAWGTCSEGHPIHYKYENVAKAIREKMTEKCENNYMIYCASDEAQFIEFMKREFPMRVLCHEDKYNVRSEGTTSGLNQDFTKITFNNEINTYIKNTTIEGDEVEKEKQMTAWKEIKEMSIHFGKKDVSNYMKGFYTLVDTKLFGRCNYIFRSRGNMSEWTCYLNEKGAAVFDLNQIAA
jgi:hypothetical protein